MIVGYHLYPEVKRAVRKNTPILNPVLTFKGAGMRCFAEKNPKKIDIFSKFSKL
jgi:hypothetical protein